MSVKLLKLKRREKPEEAKQKQAQGQQQGQQADDGCNEDKQDTTESGAKSNGLAPVPERDDEVFETQLVWRNILLFVLLHSAIPIALSMAADPLRRPHWRTVAWMYISSYVSGLGITGGAHRLWSHKAYKAHPVVESLLMLLQTVAGQNSILTWSRDHRVHHKFSETDADPHNIKRGFFFAHMGWLCCKKHPEVRKKGALIDMSDLEANPIVMFQHRHFWWLAVLFTVVLPVMVPVWFWQERLWTSFIFSFMCRYLISLHATWLVNSAAHYNGHRPYDKQIEARESPWVIMFGLGEGFHNYHHTFPYDYSTSEHGPLFNVTTFFIDLLAVMGLVHDRRKVDQQTIDSRKSRTGESGLANVDRLVSGKHCNDATGKSVSANVQTVGRQQHECEVRTELGDVEVAGKFVSPFNMDYISGPTSLKYTM